MRSRVALAGLASCALLALAGCKNKADDTANDAGGQILSRSVGDDMLPYDTVRSQPPLVSPEKAAPGIADATRGATEAADDEAAKDDADRAGDAAAEAAAAQDEVKPDAE